MDSCFGNRYSELRAWVILMMATFRCSEYEAIVILGQCKWPEPPLEIVELA